MPSSTMRQVHRAFYAVPGWVKYSFIAGSHLPILLLLLSLRVLWSKQSERSFEALRLASNLSGTERGAALDVLEVAFQTTPEIPYVWGAAAAIIVMLLLNLVLGLAMIINPDQPVDAKGLVGYE